MESNSANKVRLLTQRHFEECPMWSFLGDSESYRPVRTPEELPEDIRDLRTKANFVSKSGIRLSGYIVGADNVFSVGIFVASEFIGFNRNLPRSFLIKELQRFSRLSGSKVEFTQHQIFPLEYETQFDWDRFGYRNYRGRFDVEPGKWHEAGKSRSNDPPRFQRPR